ncbi:hypothetical protein JEY40_26645 [Bradyrhizobium japonicum]|uniref:hypothetical protein n=1 Tax=Bradyrhizobium japonicum TaxID=375 RepID=UPI00200C7860|nr:hypothetical protein [Bradyrhizobium japonicum]UQD69583.1 hypothetical protein JEY40_26645 [Bradyrhizobium japonicum]
MRRRLAGLEETLIVDFLNATHPKDIAHATKVGRKDTKKAGVDAGFVGFYSKYGLPIDGKSMEREFAEEQQADIEQLFWAAVGTEDKSVDHAAADFNRLIAEWSGYSVKPTLRRSDEGHPQLVYRVGNLLAYMAMEAALIAEAGAKAKHCENCFTLFIHGPRTGRRSHAEYCSDKCRVAALRKRNKGKA